MIEYYGEVGQEILDSEPEEVIENVFDSLKVIDEYEYPFVVYTFTPRKISLGAGRMLEEDGLLEKILEELDEEFGDPDGDYTEPTEKMTNAAKEFISVIESEYTSFACEQTGEKKEYSKEDVLAIVGRE